MVRLPIFQVDAFTSEVFAGNPAAVVPLSSWPPDATLQKIAAENNLSETAFLLGGAGEYEIRWMTPTSEVDLCGHATLASAFVILTRLEPQRSAVRFTSRSGLLPVEREAERLVLDFPARPPRPGPTPPGLAEALGRAPQAVLQARDLLAVYDSEDEVRALHPDMARLLATGAFAVIATARGKEADFVSRFFAPGVGVPEDPVTGSAHCTLVPYWADRLGRESLRARQVSARGGELFCERRGDRVRIAGQAVLYLEGTIEV